MSYRVSKNDFHDWLHQRIWVSGNETAQRQTYIPALYDSLTHFMKKKGYVMDRRWNRGPRIVAKWLYAIHVHEIARKQSYRPLGYPEIEHRNWPEDKEVFDFHLDLEAIDEFMYSWRNNEDFDTSTRHGFRTQAELQTLLYTYADIDNSVQGRRLAAKFEVSESEDSDGHEESHDLMSGAFHTTKKIIGYNTL